MPPVSRQHASATQGQGCPVGAATNCPAATLASTPHTPVHGRDTTSWQCMKRRSEGCITCGVNSVAGKTLLMAAPRDGIHTPCRWCKPGCGPSGSDLQPSLGLPKYEGRGSLAPLSARLSLLHRSRNPSSGRGPPEAAIQRSRAFNVLVFAVCSTLGWRGCPCYESLMTNV